MASFKFVSLLVIALLVLCIGHMEVEGSRCCNNHPVVGSCVPGRDDDPEANGKCWQYCINDCERGGVCKKVGSGHVCHCYCY
ncbi:hypothetical protein RHGRI_009284 [Rhododendron griersonianum]|uniref:Defensin-like protein 20 n=1 Tax=Rhododendron griersonianum TaxID=479676 RepID=A0AAV6L4X2_9ERIC|nr:hypothetical protein RHGRI_009284 [Rhododendron griersonianum]